MLSPIKLAMFKHHSYFNLFPKQASEPCHPTTSKFIHGTRQEQLQVNGLHHRILCQLRCRRCKLCSAEQYQWYPQPIREWYKLCHGVDLDKHAILSITTFLNIRAFRHLLLKRSLTSLPNYKNNHSHCIIVCGVSYELKCSQ